MKVLLIGASGLLGNALKRCVPAGLELTAPSRKQLDILDSASAASAVARVRPEVIVNCAGFSSVDGCERDPTRANCLNAIAVANLALLCRREAIRLVHVSSAFVFSGRHDCPYRESDLPEPLNAYGRSKLAGELAIAAAMDDYCIVRTSWLYGRGGENFVASALAMMRARNYAKLVVDQIGAPTWTPSLAAVLWLLAGSHHRGIFHWCDSGSVTRYELGRAVALDALELGLLTSMPTLYPAVTAEFASPAQRPAFSTLDRTNTELALGLTASFWRHSLRSMLQEMARDNGLCEGQMQPIGRRTSALHELLASAPGNGGYKCTSRSLQSARAATSSLYLAWRAACAQPAIEFVSRRNQDTPRPQRRRTWNISP